MGFSVETRFHFDAHINRHSVRIWAAENPELTVASPLHPQSVTVWRPLPSVGIFSPVFIEGLVSSDCNFSLVRDELSPVLMDCVITVTSGWFQQGSTRCHTSTLVLEFLRYVLRCEPLWTYLKNGVFWKLCNSLGTEIFHSIRNLLHLWPEFCAVYFSDCADFPSFEDVTLNVP